MTVYDRSSLQLHGRSSLPLHDRFLAVTCNGHVTVTMNGHERLGTVRKERSRYDHATVIDLEKYLSGFDLLIYIEDEILN